MVNVDIKLDGKFCSKNLIDSIIFFLPFFWEIIRTIGKQKNKHLCQGFKRRVSYQTIEDFLNFTYLIVFISL